MRCGLLGQRRGDIRRVEALRDVLRAIRIPGRNGEEKHLLGPGAVIFRHQPLQELAVILDDARLAPDLDPLAVDIVDQEKMRLRILGEIAERDILPVAREIGKADGLLIEHLEEARRPAAMLDVRLAVLARRGEEDARLRLR